MPRTSAARILDGHPAQELQQRLRKLTKEEKIVEEMRVFAAECPSRRVRVGFSVDGAPATRHKADTEQQFEAMKPNLKALAGLFALFVATQAHATRWYSPSTGRWFSRDPIGEQGGVNLYEFVRNEPVSRTDALGLFPFIPPGGTINDPWPKPPTGGPGYHDIPNWFERPADEGKPCCCTPPGKMKKFERTDDPPMRIRLDFKIDLKLEGCYKDLAIVWWTCWRPNGSGGWMPGFDNQTSAWLAVSGITIPGVGDISTGPHITQAYIRYLSCENGKWVKHKEGRGRTYVWHDGRWTW